MVLTALVSGIVGFVIAYRDKDKTNSEDNLPKLTLPPDPKTTRTTSTVTTVTMNDLLPNKTIPNRTNPTKVCFNKITIA